MLILGLSIGEFSSAALVHNGILLGASYEERFHRKKCLSGFPYKALEYLLSSNNLKSSDIDAVGVVNKFTSGLDLSLVQRLHSFSVDDYIREAHQYYYPILYSNKKIDYASIFKDKIIKNVYPEKIQKEILKNGENKKNSQKLRTSIIHHALGSNKVNIEFIEHHYSHALYGLLFNQKDNYSSLIFTADSMGDETNSNVYDTANGDIKNIFSSSSQNLGKLFRNITLLMGMKPYQHEYKVMGLAPYADEKYASRVKNILEEYMYGFNKDWLFRKKPKDHYFEFQKKFEGIRFDNIAGGLQNYFEERLLEWFEYFLKKHTKHKNIIFSGGLSMNVKANMKIEKLCESYGKTFFSAPSGDDFSHPISSAYAVYFGKNKFYSKKNKLVNLDKLNLGYYFSESDKNKLSLWAKKKSHLNTKIDFNKIAKLLKKGKIFALCHGKAEFGARALGFRSIIADPSNFETVKKINTAIKMRDFWMPFAPAILKGWEKKYFITNNIKNHRFMASSADTTELGSEKLKAAAHPYDNSIRPMIVTRESNEIFYNIIKVFGELTGTYALLNTSLNLHGSPIVNDAEDLIYVLENSKLDGAITEENIILI